jgi:putative ABC transport system substrate-binding protein
MSGAAMRPLLQNFRAFWPPIKMFRRTLLIMFFLLAPAAGEAQPGTSRVGVLIPDMARSQSQVVNGLRDELDRIGYQERKNIRLEIRNTKGNPTALQPAAMELVNQKVDLILVTGTRATQVAKSATRDIPIVFVHPADPVSLGFVKSTAMPGGNLTGVAGFALQMTEKRLAIFKEIIPSLQKIYIFYDPNDKFSRENFSFAKETALKSGLQVVGQGVKSSEELKVTLGGLQIRKGEALFHIPDNLTESNADFIFDVARQKKLPTMFNDEAWAIKGAMAAYGPNYYEMGRQAASLVETIVKGRKPESLPIQQANKFDLVLNYRTASFIGVTLSRDMLKKADKVIR